MSRADTQYLGIIKNILDAGSLGAVSYTHLTLPTKRIVENYVVAGSLKNKQNTRSTPQVP